LARELRVEVDVVLAVLVVRKRGGGAYPVGENIIERSPLLGSRPMSPAGALMDAAALRVRSQTSTRRPYGPLDAPHRSADPDRLYQRQTIR
jgi:hypothetical protein